MSNISAVGSIPSFITSSNFASRINWRLAGKISLIAVGVFLLAATVLCLGFGYSLRNELSATQREHSQPLTEERRQEWLRRARAYFWPGLTEDAALVEANNALRSMEEQETLTIDMNAPSYYYLLNERLDDPDFQSNPQRAWNLWRVQRGGAEYAEPEDSVADFFERELGFSTSTAYDDIHLLRSYRVVPGISFANRVKAYIRTSVRNLFGMA